MDAGLRLGHVRAAQGHPGPQGQRARPVPVARQEAALLQRHRSHRQREHFCLAPQSYRLTRIGLVHVQLPSPLCAMVALRCRGHLLRHIFVLPRDSISRRAEHQHTGMCIQIYLEVPR